MSALFLKTKRMCPLLPVCHNGKMKQAWLLFLFSFFFLSSCGGSEDGYLLVQSSFRGQEVASMRIDCETDKCIKELRSVDLEPLPEGTFCTKIYGGPQEISLAGNVNGEDIAASFNRSGGCEIARFESVVPFLEKNGLAYDDLFPETSSSIRDNINNFPREAK
jgi:hypothetical protein